MPLRPACFQDVLEGKSLFQKVGNKMLEVWLGAGRYCDGISGETYHLGWKWKGIDIGGSQGHVHVNRYRSASEYRMYTQSEPVLWAEDGAASPPMSQLPLRELLIRLDMAVSGCNREIAERTSAEQHEGLGESLSLDLDASPYRLSGPGPNFVALDDTGKPSLSVDAERFHEPYVQQAQRAWKGTATKELLKAVEALIDREATATLRM